MPLYSQLDLQRIHLLSVVEAQLEVKARAELGVMLARFTGLSERQHRRYKIVALITGSCDKLGLLIIRGLWEASNKPLAREILLDLMTSRPLTELLGYEKVQRLYLHARACGDVEISRLFLAAPAAKLRGRFVDEGDENEKMASTSLGLRKSYARGRDRMRLDRLLHDRNPAVVRLLLQNPRIVERDVVKIAARRPTETAIVQEIYRSSRWIARYHIKKALVFNPYTPVDIAMPLLPYLLRPDLRELSRLPNIEYEIRMAARKVLSRV